MTFAPVAATANTVAGTDELNLMVNAVLRQSE